MQLQGARGLGPAELRNRVDGAVSELYDLAVVPGAMRPMSLGFGSDEILGLITHDPLADEPARELDPARS